MATTINTKSDHHFMNIRSGTQRVCVALGLVFVTLGLAGVLRSDVLGMHLGGIHHLIYLVTGSLCLWSGMADDLKRSYILCCVMGFTYATLGIAGFMLGSSEHIDLWRVLPGMLEFTTHDHTFHLFTGFIFLLGSFYQKMRVDEFSRSIVDIQRRK